MDKFKTGSEVIVVDKGNKYYGATYKVVGSLDGRLRCKRIDDRDNTIGLDTIYNPGELRSLNEDKGMTKRNTEKEYTFRVKDTNMVNPDEINISREYPIAIISSKGSSTLVYYHGSIIAKAQTLGLRLPKCEATLGNNGFIECSNGEETGQAIEALKAIIKAPWKSSGVEITVKLLGVG